VDHPDKNIENKSPEELDVWPLYFGDYFGEKLSRVRNRYQYANGRNIPPEPEIIRYNKDNTNC